MQFSIHMKPFQVSILLQSITWSSHFVKHACFEKWHGVGFLGSNLVLWIPTCRKEMHFWRMIYSILYKDAPSTDPLRFHLHSYHLILQFSSDDLFGSQFPVRCILQKATWLLIMIVKWAAYWHSNDGHFRSKYQIITVTVVMIFRSIHKKWCSSYDSGGFVNSKPHSAICERYCRWLNFVLMQSCALILRWQAMGRMQVRGRATMFLLMGHWLRAHLMGDAVQELKLTSVPTQTTFAVPMGGMAPRSRSGTGVDDPGLLRLYRDGSESKWVYEVCDYQNL